MRSKRANLDEETRTNFSVPPTFYFKIPNISALWPLKFHVDFVAGTDLSMQTRYIASSSISSLMKIE
jgi:hypothetical protein